MALPNDKISTSMVATALGGVSTHDVGSLCTHNNINKWSRHKPYAYPTVSSLYGASGVDDSRLINLNFFLDVKELPVNMLPLNYTRGWQQWGGWSPPNGSSTEPFRIGDFRGYNHKAKPPYGKLTMQNRNGGGKFIVNPNPHSLGFYNVRLDLSLADLKLSELNMGPYGDLASSYLTVLVIFRKVGSPNLLDYDNYLLFQSTSDFATAENYGYIDVDFPTYMFEDHASNINYDTVVMCVYIAPMITNNIPVDGVSMQIDETLIPIVYFSGLMPQTRYAYIQNGVVVDDIPAIGAEATGTIDYPRGNPYISNGVLYFDILTIQAQYSIAGEMKADIYLRNEVTFSRTIKLADFVSSANNSVDVINQNVSITLMGLETAGVFLKVYPVFNTAIWTGNYLEDLFE